MGNEGLAPSSCLVAMPRNVNGVLATVPALPVAVTGGKSVERDLAAGPEGPQLAFRQARTSGMPESPLRRTVTVDVPDVAPPLNPGFARALLALLLEERERTVERPR